MSTTGSSFFGAGSEAANKAAISSALNCLFGSSAGSVLVIGVTLSVSSSVSSLASVDLPTTVKVGVNGSASAVSSVTGSSFFGAGSAAANKAAISSALNISFEDLPSIPRLSGLSVVFVTVSSGMDSATGSSGMDFATGSSGMDSITGFSVDAVSAVARVSIVEISSETAASGISSAMSSSIILSVGISFACSVSAYAGSAIVCT
ncbi:unknown [Clostridium sp. CAG:590]|nr:unknown [Clostridium sp. CAG:590]